MYNERNVPPPDIRVTPVVRYLVTRYLHPYQNDAGEVCSHGKHEVIGEFEVERLADEIAGALLDKQNEVASKV